MPLETRIRTFAVITLVCACGLSPARTWADPGGPSGQFTVRTGYAGGSANGADGAVADSLSISNPMELEYELFTSLRASVYFRTLIGYDLSAATVAYLGVFAGRRFYLWSDGVAYRGDQDGLALSAVPRWRFFTGVDAGFTEVSAKTVGTVLQVNASQIEVGPSFGVIYNLGKSVGLEALVGLGYGLGISDVQVNTTLQRLSFGLTFYL